ncbi:MAG: hypothetical protein M1831_005758 [Alyxoria varia]|nr:MAG: hypothetical protein M1831_005758 [Alyxoria varia]
MNQYPPSDRYNQASHVEYGNNAPNQPLNFDQTLPPRPEGRKILGGYTFRHWLVRLIMGIIIGIIIGVIFGVVIHFAKKDDKDD